MLAFCGQDKCVVDANGRVKLSPRLIADFTRECGGEVILHCLSEGAVAIYPEKIYNDIRERARSAETLNELGSSIVRRRELRRFGAMSLPDRVTSQGRLTVPVGFREFTGLMPGVEAYVIGVEVGAEIWSAERWKREMELVNGHLELKSAEEMAADIRGE